MSNIKTFLKFKNKTHQYFCCFIAVKGYPIASGVGVTFYRGLSSFKGDGEKDNVTK